MLETVKKQIAEIEPPFHQFFQQYVLDIQDSCIASEVAFAMRNNFLDSAAINRIMNGIVEELS